MSEDEGTSPTPKEQLETAAEATATPPAEIPPEDQPPGVAVVRVKGAQPGQEDIQILPLGGMDRLSIPALLELAVKIDRRNLGLEAK